MSVQHSCRLNWDLLRAAPPAVKEQAFQLTASLLRNWPDELHSWDMPSHTVAAVAGIVADVPRIIMHLANDYPSPSIEFDAAYPVSWFGVLSRSKRVKLLAHSDAAAVEWASELGTEESPVHGLTEALTILDCSSPDELRSAP